ncbi:MFS transporter [Labedaea rhizosphaerae]|uniref:Putative MFS family arabinose efflux permease n=1 Tax=Labedaea rhizosphaerae TaxID=598644 RepID=A0A4R6SF99_LABRH|nr:MFS transporter [Labedaea rhizosphaerae]TDP97766.1 putative MFS family arabinose efflux permease [Labedaea rhizosphaerae]
MSAHRTVVLATMAAAFIAMMDSSIINVAVYSIGSDLRASLPQMGMMISGYVLFYGLFLVTGGRLGDIHGHRRLFLVGLSAFTLVSAACSVAPDPESLIVLRCAQGTAAALFFPQVLSMVHTTLPGPERERALSLFGMVIGLAGVVGQVLTGVLLHANILGLTWHQVFLINIPVGLAAIIGVAVATLRKPPRKRRAARSELDVRGAALLAAGMLLCVFPITEGRVLGWPWWCFLLLGGSVPVLVLFWVWERRLAARGGQPLATPALWRLSGYRLGNAVLVTLLGANAAFFFVLVIQVQGPLRYSPLAAGLLLTPHAIAFGATSVLARKRTGAAVLVLGCALNVLGYALALVAALAGPNGIALIPALLVTGVGQGLIVAPLVGRILADVPEGHAGAASGVMETSIQLAVSFGITVIGLVYFAGHSPKAAYTVSLAVIVGLAVTALALVVALLRAPSAERTTTR